MLSPPHHPPSRIWAGLVGAFALALAVGCSDAEQTDSSAPADKEDAGSIIGFEVVSGVDSGGTVDDGEAADVTVEEDVGEDIGSPDPGTFGWPCAENDECDSDFCIPTPSGKVCTKTCVDSCPKNWQCKQAGTDDPTFICVPKFVLLCRPCSSHGDCGQIGTEQGQAKCVPNAVQGSDFVNGSFCGAPCAGDSDCPTDFECKSVSLPDEVTTSQCLPKGGECTCSKAEVDLKLSTACWRANQFGKCEGKRTCTKDGLTLCNVNEPSAEVCDGEDNNCDGKIDEDGAVGCKTWFPDNDGDGAGITNGDCMCQNPGVGYATGGGDCNDFAKSIHPGAKLHARSTLP